MPNRGSETRGGTAEHRPTDPSRNPNEDLEANRGAKGWAAKMGGDQAMSREPKVLDPPHILEDRRGRRVEVDGIDAVVA